MIGTFICRHTVGGICDYMVQMTRMNLDSALNRFVIRFELESVRNFVQSSPYYFIS